MALAEAAAPHQAAAANPATFTGAGTGTGTGTETDTGTDTGTDYSLTPTTAPQDIRGSASPKGEARRKAPPSPSEAKGAAGRTTGGGGRAV